MQTMFNSHFEKTAAQSPCKEGDLFKVITAYGKTFEIYYGYYEESDRHSLYAEPIEIYPSFLETPVYTDDGIPFATAIQSPCEHFKGERDEDSTCYQCTHYENVDELLGVCRCKARKEPRNA